MVHLMFLLNSLYFLVIRWPWESEQDFMSSNNVASIDLNSTPQSEEVTLLLVSRTTPEEEMIQTALRICLHCGAAIFGRKRLYCSDAHRKAYKRQKPIGEALKVYADANLSVLVLSSAELEALIKNLNKFIAWERINENNPHNEESKTAHKITADMLEIMLKGVSNYV